MGLIFSKTGLAFKRALELRPEDFEIEDKYIFRDNKTNYVWWICNGRWFFDFAGSNCSIKPYQNPEGVHFRLIERHYLWFCFKRWEKNIIKLELPIKKLKIWKWQYE